MKNLYSIYYDELDPFNYFEQTIPVHDVDQIKADGAIILWGGEDISPAIYGETANSYTHARNRPSSRDLFEIAAAKRAMELGIPIIGVCRGAQLICALSGGKLVQHVENHHGSHKITTHDGRTLVTNSIHHQMMIPDGTNHKLLAWCPTQVSDCFIGEHNKKLDIAVEPEVVWFKDTKALAIQGHPEYLTPTTPFVKYCLEEFINCAILP